MARLILVAGPVAGAVLFGACGSSASVPSGPSSSPGRAATDLFHAIQAKNCDQVYALQTRALDTQEGGRAKVCQTMLLLEARYRANAFRVDRVVSHAHQADVYATRTNPDGTTRSAALDAIVEDNTWKINGFLPSSPTTTSSSIASSSTSGP